MDFSLSPEQEKLRDEFTEFFKREMEKAPAGWQGGRVEDPYLSDENWTFHVKVARKLGEKGWLMLSLPEEYGGLNASPVVQMVFNEVAGYHKAPGVDVFGVKMIGPVIYMMGNEEQKKEHLKPIARGEIFWCQGWSEPDAGSDLAALSTEGVRDGDHYIVNGQKVWTTGAHRADWIFLLVRTDPTAKRSRGLTLLLADMKTPGISVEPILAMDGHHSFNEIFLDNVHIPVKNRIGEENLGWEVAKAISNFERSGVLPVGSIQRELEDLINYCKETRSRGGRLINDPLVRNGLANLAVEIEVARALYYRIACLHEKSEPIETAALSSAAKIFTANLYQRLIYTGCHIMGLFSQVKQGSKWAPLKGVFESSYQSCIGPNIAAGTSEIQRNIIAWTALGLPRP
jgi:alkylation response protein AidB-like acyl-CoA dehydrogenase